MRSFSLVPTPNIILSTVLNDKSSTSPSPKPPPQPKKCLLAPSFLNLKCDPAVFEVSRINGVSLVPPSMSKVAPSKVNATSPFKFVPLPPVMTRLSALFYIVADPAAP